MESLNDLICKKHKPKEIFRLFTGSLEIFSLVNYNYKKISHRLFLNNLVYIALADNWLFLSGFDAPSFRVYLFNTETQKIWRTPDMLTERKYHSLVKHGASIYAIGGIAGVNKQKSCEVFDGKSWEAIAPMNSPRASCSAVSVKSCIFVFGDTIENTVEVYREKEWEKLTVKLPGANMNLCIVPVSGDRVLIVGGGSKLTGMSNSVHLFSTQDNCFEFAGRIRSPDAFRANAVKFQDTFWAVGLKGVYRFGSSWEVKDNSVFCKLCERWVCEGDCFWLRRRNLLFLKLSLRSPTLK